VLYGRVHDAGATARLKRLAMQRWQTSTVGMLGLPVTLLIDRKGRIAEFHPGKVDKAAFEAEIRQVLTETP